MSVYQVQPNGNAPAGLVPGDFVNTQAGLYQVASPGAYGATYNPKSGYWSIKADGNSAGASAAQSALRFLTFDRLQVDSQYSHYPKQNYFH